MASPFRALGQYEKAAQHLSLSDEITADFVELKRRMM